MLKHSQSYSTVQKYGDSNATICLKKIHVLACKKFLSVGITTPNSMVYGECGRYPIYIISQIRCLRHWLKIACMHNHRIPKLAYNMLVHADSVEKMTWASNTVLDIYYHLTGLVCMA